MKSKLLPAALAAAAGLALAPGHARAQSTTQVVVNPGSEEDLFLGFQESGNDNDLIVDIGSDAQYLDATAPFTIQFGVIPTGQTNAGTAVTSLSADLNSIYGSWTTSSGETALEWGVIGDDENGNEPVVFETQDVAESVVPTNPSYNQINNETGQIDSLSFQLSKDFSTVNSTESASVGTGSAESWDSFKPTTTAFKTGINIEQSANEGPISTLNLFEAVPDQNGTGPVTKLGTLSLGSNGELTFTPTSVPEPSTWLSIIGGALMLGFFRVRKGVRAS